MGIWDMELWLGIWDMEYEIGNMGVGIDDGYALKMGYIGPRRLLEAYFLCELQ